MIRVAGVAYDIPDAEKSYQMYDSESRANNAASFRLTQAQRERLGEAFWTHEFAPTIAFKTRKEARLAAIRSLAGAALSVETGAA